ncbi:MAG: alpha/beta hydrolase [Acidimicrobiales bacterium]
MNVELASGRFRLAAYLAEPPVADTRPPLLVLCHCYPSGSLGASATGRSYPALADRIANEGWRVVTFAFRGWGGSTGYFSLGGWLDDLLAVVDQASTFGENRGVWLAGFGTGGGLCISAAARRPHVAGVAVLGAPADYADWASHPRRLLQHAREIGAITDPAYPPALDRWTRQLRDIRPVDDASVMAPRPLLVLHGSDDESVPSFDGRVVGDAHGSADLRIISGAAHDLRHDPRAVAILSGWLDRERHRSQTPIA